MCLHLFVIYYICYNIFGKLVCMLPNKKDNILKYDGKIRMIKRIMFPLLMTILTSFVGIIFSLTFVGLPMYLKIIANFFIYLPTVTFLIITITYVKLYKIKDSYIVFNVLAGFYAIGLFIYYFLLLFSLLALLVLNPVKNVKYYYVYSGDSRIFPEKIPDSAEDIYFYYSPMFLQAADVKILYYKDSKMTPELFDNKYRDISLWVGNIKSNNKMVKEISFPYDIDTNINDYMIYFIEGDCDNSGYCNHGNYLIAAYNEKTNEIFIKETTW